MKKKFKLTLIFMSYKNFINDINYVNYIQKKIKDEKIFCNFLYCYDNELSDEEISLFNKDIKIVNGKNLGKIKRILDLTKYVDSEFIKIVDYDDSINFSQLKEMCYDIENKNYENVFLTHESCKIYEDHYLYGKKIYDEKEIKICFKDGENVTWKITPNAKAIYSTDLLKIINSFKIKKMGLFDDNLLSLVHETFYKKKIELEYKPYIQYHALGQTSEVKKTYKDTLNLVINLSTLFNKLNLKLNDSNLDPKSFRWSFIVYKCNRKYFKLFLIIKVNIFIKRFWYS